MKHGGIIAAVALFLGAGLYYGQFFTWGAACLLAGYLVALSWALLATGYRLFTPAIRFPVGTFLMLILAFTLVRWAVIYFVLQYRLPAETIFRYPARSLWYVVPTTATLVLIGFGYAQYCHHRKSPDAVALPPALLRFRAGGQEIQLPVSDLLHVQANGEYLIYRCADRRYLRYQRLREAEGELVPFGFVRTHRSHLVRWAAVREVAARSVILADGSQVPVSKSYRHGLHG